MAVNILSADSAAQWVANTAGDTYVLKEGVYLGVLGTAISGTAAVTNRKFQIDGHVIGEGGGSGMFIGTDAANGGSRTIDIGANGSVLGESYGIVAHGGGLHFTNKGSVTGDVAGLYMSGDLNAVLNQGTILSYDETGIDSQGDHSQIENDGAIIGETCGVLLAGDEAKLINNGSISSNDDSFSTTAVNMTGGGGLFINNGTVTTNGGRTILGSGDSEGVVNHGTIYGYVALGGGSDEFYNNGGSVYGIIDLGDGSDIFSSKNGYFVGSVTGGLGDDHYFLYDGDTEISEDSSDGDDTVHANVNYTLRRNFENLVLLGDADLTGRGNYLDNFLSGNSGDNKLYGQVGNDVFEAGEGRDLYNGGAGEDMVIFADTFMSGITVNLSTGKGGGAATGQVFVGIENILGTHDKDRIIGSAAANRLDGHQGDDTLKGGGGKDIFVFEDTYHTDTITDFQDTIDRIELDFSGLASFSDLDDMISQKGKDVVINFTAVNGGTVVIIKHADISDFSGADFIFV